jgi:osmotically-inducible protein OsmY
MHTACGKRGLIYCAMIGSVTFAWVSVAERAGAQDVDAPLLNRSISVTVPTTQGVDPIADEKLRMRVQDALHSDPYFYDEHVTVSIKDGAVVLHGFVSSAWDLRDAIRIASKAAGDRRVIDNLSIELGGGR